MESQQYKQAIERNLAELQRAILNRTTMLGVEDAHVKNNLFLWLAYSALHNDYFAHCMKVFEIGKQAASFWYIYHVNPQPIDTYARRNKICIETLRTISKKLKHIRDKTHFHIDKVGVLDTKAVWSDASLTGKELSEAIDTAWAILTDLQQSLSLPEVRAYPEYDRTLVKRLVCRIIEQ